MLALTRRLSRILCGLSHQVAENGQFASPTSVDRECKRNQSVFQHPSSGATNATCGRAVKAGNVSVCQQSSTSSATHGAIVRGQPGNPFQVGAASRVHLTPYERFRNCGRCRSSGLRMQVVVPRHT